MAAGQPAAERAAYELAVVLEPLRGLLGTPEALPEFVRDELGFDVPDALRGIGIDLGAVDAVITALGGFRDALAADPVDDAAVAGRSGQLAVAVARLTAEFATAGTGASEGLDPAFLAASHFAENLPRRLLDWLAVGQVEQISTAALQLLRLLGIVEVEPVTADAATFTTEHVRRTTALQPLVDLVTDPHHWLRDVYGWGTDHAALALLLERLWRLAVVRGIPAALSWSDLQRAQALAGAPQTGAPPELRLPVISPETTYAEFDAGLALVVLPRANGTGEGLALVPFSDARLGEQLELNQLGTWLFGVSGSLDLQAGFGIVARPGQGIRALTDIDGAGASATGTFEARVTRVPTAGEYGLLAIGGGAGLFVTGAEFRAAALLDAADSAELLIEVALKGAHLRIAMGTADGFLRSMVPDLDLTFDVTLGISTRRGMYFVGGTGLEIVTAVNQRAGPVQLRGLRFAMHPPPPGEPAGLDLTGGADVGLSIGPVTAVVQGIGGRVRLRERTGGNVGPLDLSTDFKGPDGIALELAAGPVSGAGFLFADEANAQYAGAMALTFEGIAVKAVGLLTTGGPAGFSLLVIVSAEFTPVPLGLGFTLEGVGGLVGINRTVAVDALRGGLKTGAAGAVLSPPDPAANAAQLVATLAGLFPPAAGRYVIGPLARLGWGSPTLITIDLCLVLELPAPVRLVILGRLRAVLPDERLAIVRLEMDLLGVIDFDRREAAVDATLVDSRLAEFPLTGAMAMRMRWGPDSTFLLALGGFHPRFAAPPGFPALDRVSVSLATGENPKLRLDAYLALTSNTVQLGARVDLSATAGGFVVVGFLAFDALVTLAPLAFVVDVAAKLAIEAGGHTLLSVSLQLTLSGPRPWRVRGRASFSILFFDVSVSFDLTIGDDPPPELPALVDVAAVVLRAFTDPRAWSAQLPVGGDPIVTLRAVDAGADVLAHPLGRLEVRQRAVPLEREIGRFGAGVPVGASRFRIAGASVGDDAVTATAVEDLFAAGQFAALSDDEKLSRPSFEAMRSGAVIGESAVVHGAPVILEVRYEQQLVPPSGVEEPEPAVVGLPGDVFAALTEAPAASSPMFAVVGAP